MSAQPRTDINFTNPYQGQTNAPMARNDLNLDTTLENSAPPAQTNTTQNTSTMPAILQAIGLGLPGVVAFATGGATGLGQLPTNGYNFLANRLGFTPRQNPLDVSSYNNPVTNYLAANENQHPGFATAGRVGGTLAGLAPIGMIAPFGAASEALGGSAAAAAPLDLAGQGALSSPLMDPKATNGQIAQSAALSPVIGTALNVAGRAFSSLTGSAARNQAIASKAYDQVKNEADAAGFQATPQNGAAVAQTLLNKYQNGGEALQSGNSDMVGIAKKNLNDAYNQMTGTGPDNLFSLSNMHDRFQDLSNKIGNYLKSGDSTKAQELIDLKNAYKDDLNTSMKNAGMPDLAQKFFNTQNYYRTQVIPLKQYPTGVGQVATELSVAHALGGMDSNLAEPLAFGFLGHGAGSKGLGVVNWGQRYLSPYNGGLGSIYRGYGAGTTAASLYGANLGGNSQQPR